jgi:hypothetical protein
VVHIHPTFGGIDCRLDVVVVSSWTMKMATWRRRKWEEEEGAR